MGVLDCLVRSVPVDAPVPILITESSIYQGIAFVGVALLYFPSKHSRLVGLRRRDVIRDIDYVGGLLSLAGLTLL